MFIFSLSPAWIALYTTWNAAFCYGAGFAWSFRLIGITHLVVACVLGDWNTWLGARTYSLVLNQVLRGARVTRIYTPGESFVTKAEGAPSTDPFWRAVWGLANVALVVGWVGLRREGQRLFKF